MRNPATKSDKIHAVPKKPRSRFFWNVAGSIFLVLGLIGIPLPILPTTPFLLLAAACYLRGSQRMYRWMMTNRYFGAYLIDYRAGQGIPLKTKLAAIILLWLGIGASVFLLLENVFLRILLIVIGVAVMIHIALIKTKKVAPKSRVEQFGDKSYSPDSLDPSDSLGSRDSRNSPVSRYSARASSNSEGRS